MFEDIEYGGKKESPMLGVTYLLSNKSSVRGSISRAHRYPLIYEEIGEVSLLNGLFVLVDASGGLKPQKIDAYDFGYYKSFGDSLFKYEARLFYFDINDVIVDTSSIQPVGDFINSESIEILGLQGEFSYQLVDNKTRISTNFSIQKSKGSFNYFDTEASVPELLLGITVLHNFTDNIDGSVSYHYISAMQFIQSDAIPSVNRLDISFRKKMKLDDMDINLKFVALNVLDDHIDISQSINRGREFYLSASLAF